MSNDKQWFWTKLVGSAVVLFALISSCIGAANMHFDLKRDVVRNEQNIRKHEVGDEKKWDKVLGDVDENRESINELKLQNARLETQYQEIMRVLQEIKTEAREQSRKLDMLEVVDG